MSFAIYHPVCHGMPLLLAMSGLTASVKWSDQWRISEWKRWCLVVMFGGGEWREAWMSRESRCSIFCSKHYAPLIVSRVGPSKQQRLIPCWLDVGPVSLTVSQHQNNIESAPLVWWVLPILLLLHHCSTQIYLLSTQKTSASYIVVHFFSVSFPSNISYCHRFRIASIANFSIGYRLISPIKSFIWSSWSYIYYYIYIFEFNCCIDYTQSNFISSFSLVVYPIGGCSITSTFYWQ